MVSPVEENRESNLSDNNGNHDSREKELIKGLFSKINLYSPQNNNSIDLTQYSYRDLLLLKRALSNQDKLRTIIGQNELEKILKFKLVDNALIGGKEDKSILKFQAAESISSLWNTFAVVSTGPYGAILGFGAYHLFLSAPIGVIIGGISFIASLPMAINKYKTDKAKLKSSLEKMIMDELLVRIMQAIDINLDNKIKSLKQNNNKQLANERDLFNKSGLTEPLVTNYSNLFDDNGRAINDLISQLEKKLSQLTLNYHVNSYIQQEYKNCITKLKKFANDKDLFKTTNHSVDAVPFSAGIQRQQSVILAAPPNRSQEAERLLVPRKTRIDTQYLKFGSYCKNNKMETAATLFGGIGTVGALSVITTLGVTVLKVLGITTLLGISLVSLPVMITLFSVSVVAAAGICAFNLYNRKKQWQREQKASLIDEQKNKLSEECERKQTIVTKLKKISSEFKKIFDITKQIKSKEQTSALRLIPTEVKEVSATTQTYTGTGQLPAGYEQSFVPATEQTNQSAYFDNRPYATALASIVGHSEASESDDDNMFEPFEDDAEGYSASDYSSRHSGLEPARKLTVTFA